MNPMLKGKSTDKESKLLLFSHLLIAPTLERQSDRSDKDKGMKQQDAKIVTIKKRKRTWVYWTMRPTIETRQRKWMEERILGSETSICGDQSETFIG